LGGAKIVRRMDEAQRHGSQISVVSIVDHAHCVDRLVPVLVRTAEQPRQHSRARQTRVWWPWAVRLEEEVSSEGARWRISTSSTAARDFARCSKKATAPAHGCNSSYWSGAEPAGLPPRRAGRHGRLTGSAPTPRTAPSGHQVGDDSRPPTWCRPSFSGRGTRVPAGCRT